MGGSSETSLEVVMKCRGSWIVGWVLAAGLVVTAAAEGPQPGNWGKWGEADERGAANYVTPERIVEAAGLIRRGEVFSLAIPLDSDGPVFPGRSVPRILMAGSGADYVAGEPVTPELPVKFADDYLFMPLQGSTQWDGLAHAWYGDRLYNGVSEREVRSGGALRLGIENQATGFVGRAVLIDVVGHKGPLGPGYAITRADIEATLKAQGTKVREGDIAVVRTGVVPAFYAIEDPVEKRAFLLAPQAGLAPEVAGWIDAQRLSAVAADNVALEVFPFQQPPLHGTLLRDLGVYIGEIWWLEDLAADCAKDGRYEFFLAAQPLKIPGGIGSPLNPVAIK
jgi:kynurenine formamidase